MAITVSFSNEDFPEGHEFEIRGLGVIPNGGSITLDAEDEARFVRETHRLVTDALEDSAMMKVSGVAIVKSVKEVLGIDPAELQTDAAVAVESPEQEVPVVPVSPATTSQDDKEVTS